MSVLVVTGYRRWLAAWRGPGDLQISESVGDPAEIPDLSALRGGAGSVRGGTPPFPAGEVALTQGRTE